MEEIGAGEFTFSVRETRIARISHRCSECNEEIPKGTPYGRVAGVSEDGFFAFKTCLSCQKDWEEVLAIDEFLDGIVHGTLWQVVDGMISVGQLEINEPIAQRWIPLIPQLRQQERSRHPVKVFDLIS